MVRLNQHRALAVAVIVIAGLTVGVIIWRSPTEPVDECEPIHGPLSNETARAAVQRFAQAVATGDQHCVDRVTTSNLAAAQAARVNATPDNWLARDRALNNRGEPTTAGSLAARREALDEASYSYQASTIPRAKITVTSHTGSATYRVTVVAREDHVVVDEVSGTNGTIG